MSLDLGTLVQYVELDPQAFNRRYAQVAADIEALRRMDAGVNVTADTSQAQSNLATVEATAQALPNPDVQVTADTSAAEAALEGLADGATEALGDAGAEGGQAMGDGILGALKALPIAGTVVAIGAVIGKSILDGLENEVREDRLAATTGLDEATVKRLATAAGEAYGANFGESIAANMDTARIAVQSGLLDPDATARDSQRVIESLSGVADIIGDDILPVARATASMLRTGLAKDADEAFDIIVKGAQAGLNISEDLLDTLNEYGSTFASLGLDGSQAIGLLNQGLAAGAPNTDFFADAIRELGIRVREGSEDLGGWLEKIGLVPGDLQKAFVAGGPAAAAGLDQLFDALRNVEDPVLRNQAAVGILGTQFEDLQLDLDQFDPSNAVAQLGAVEGAASGAIATLGDNTKGQLESAQRSIQVAADGIKGALAAAFGDDIEKFATSVQENRGPLVRFLLDLANGALDVGRSMVTAAAAGIEGFGQFAGETAPDMIEALAAILAGLDSIPGVDLSGPVESLSETAEFLRGIPDDANAAADALRTGLIENGIDPAQEKLNSIGDGLINDAEFHDATVALANDVNGIGYAADGSKLAVDRMGASFDATTEAGATLDGQIRTAVDSLNAQIDAGIKAGRTQDELSADYAANREALLAQVEAMGFTRDEAEALIDTYGAIPAQKKTTIIADTVNARESIKAFRDDIANIPLTRTFTARYVEVQEAGGNTPGRAGGGPVWPGQAFWVGEHGPELVEFGAPGNVHTAAASAAAASGTGSSSLSRGDMDYLAERIAEGVAARPTNLDGQQISTSTSRNLTMGRRS